MAGLLNFITQWQFVIQSTITIAVAAIGWIIAHRLTSERDAINKRKEMRLKYLVDLYRKIERRLGGTIDSQDIADDISTAVADLQLFGDSNQVRSAREIAKSFAGVHTETLDISILLFELCNTIRAELQLPPLEEPVMHLSLRYTPPEQQSATTEVQGLKKNEPDTKRRSGYCRVRRY
jgi:hypothetical protein